MGSPVLKAKITSKYKPLAFEMIMGINIPKYNAALYGQKAIANTTPIKKVPNILFSLNFSESFSKKYVYLKI